VLCQNFLGHKKQLVNKKNKKEKKKGNNKRKKHIPDEVSEQSPGHDSIRLNLGLQPGLRGSD
jgi:hypothetical protein